MNARCQRPVRALLLLAAAPALGAVPAAVDPLTAQIESYVAEGLAHNLALRASSLEVERNAAALDVVRARYWPEVSFDARYSEAHGGRSFDFPIGTLLNPVYSTLNDLLAASGQTGNFPQVTDQQLNFLRPREQDTALNLRLPLYAPAIPAAVRAQRAALSASAYARLALARRLKRDISVAYLRWLQARAARGIVAASESLLTENVRVNRSLYDNGKVTEDRVLRARAELLAVEQQQREADNGESQARSYVNFLLNRALDAPLIAAEPSASLDRAHADLAVLKAAALQSRPERGQLQSGVRAAEAQTAVASAARRPTVSLGATGGTQGERYRVGEGRNYSTVSLIASWALFDGGRRRAEVSAARAGARSLDAQREQLDRQIELEVQQALDGFETAADGLATAEARVVAARAGFRIATRKRDEGAINQVEFIDARSNLTGAELNLNNLRFEWLARRAELDYAAAAGSLPGLDDQLAPQESPP